MDGQIASDLRKEARNCRQQAAYAPDIAKQRQLMTSAAELDAEAAKG